MKNRVLLPSLLVSFVLCLLFIGIGVKTMNKHADNSGDWHFIAALLGVIGFSILLIICLFGFYAIVFSKKNLEGVAAIPKGK